MQRSPADNSRAPHLGPERRRPAILDAALEIAAAEGISAVSIASVADHLGVTRPVVYACFGDRTEMLTALAAREEELLLDGALAAMSLSQGASDSEAAIITGFQGLLAFVQAHPLSWKVLFEDYPEPHLRAVFGRGRRLIGAEFETLVGPAMEQWGVADPATRLPVLTELFLSSCEAAVRLLLSEDHGWTPDELGAQVGAAVHRMLRDA